MHILLGALGVLVTLLVLLKRLDDAGIDIGGLNPFAWRRRRAWRQKFEAHPINAVDDPRELAALLVVGAAKLDGELSAAQKHALLKEFEQTFALTPRQAAELLGASGHLLGAPQLLDTHLAAVTARARERLTPEQVDSVLGMMQRVAAADGALTESQGAFLERVRAALAPPASPTQGVWS